MKNIVDNPSFWEEIYRNKNARWNMKSPTPAFVDLLNEKKFKTNSKIIILGSGYGYDALAAAKAGLFVTAIDISKTAVDYAKKMAAEEQLKINFLIDDFFNLPENHTGYFDLVYDYVTLCAINPVRRDEYAKMITSILKCGGRLIALLFPVEDRPGGPPFGLNVNEITEVFSKYLHLELTTDKINSIKPRKGREVLQIYKKVC